MPTNRDRILRGELPPGRLWIFDEIHKYRSWRGFLKGLYDSRRATQFGIALLEPSRRREAIERYLNEVILRIFPVLPYDERSADWHGRERARLRQAGKEPPYFDGLIASIARTTDLTLVTTNVRDFRYYKGLQVENWRAVK